MHSLCIARREGGDNEIFGKKEENFTTVVIKKEHNITAVAAMIIKKRPHSHLATLKTRQRNRIGKYHVYITGTHHS